MTELPQSEQQPHSHPDATDGSLERALSGDYLLSVGDVVREAWERISGNKGTLWKAILMYMATLFVLSLVLGLLFGTSPVPPEQVPPEGVRGNPLEQLLTALLITPLWVGLFFQGVALASDRRTKPTSIFSWYDKTAKLFLTYVLMGLMILLGLLLLVLPGIYLAVAYQMALPLVADKGLRPWQALETSRKALTHKWFSFFGLWLVAVAAITVSMVLLGIPLIWVMPALVIGLGISYRNIFGAEEASLRRAAGE